MGAIDCAIGQLLLDSENLPNERASSQRDASKKFWTTRKKIFSCSAEDIVEADLSMSNPMLVGQESL